MRLSGPHRLWSESDISKLIENYPNSSYGELSIILERTKASIKLKAKRLKLKRHFKRIKNSELSVLLLDNPISFYWVGFLTADGHFSKQKRIILVLSAKDIDHLLKFGKYISCPNIHKYKRSFRISCCDTTLVPLITNKFNLSNNKTRNPPDIIFDNDDLFLSFFAGFVDGDGCISGTGNRRSIRIKVHRNWLKKLIEYEDRIYRIFNMPKTTFTRLNKQEYASFGLSNRELLSNLKKKLISLNLPLLSRKWNRINEHIHKAIQNRDQAVSDLRSAGLSLAEISRQLNIKYSTLYMWLHRKSRHFRAEPQAHDGKLPLLQNHLRPYLPSGPTESKLSQSSYAPSSRSASSRSSGRSS